MHHNQAGVGWQLRQLEQINLAKAPSIGGRCPCIAQMQTLQGLPIQTVVAIHAHVARIDELHNRVGAVCMGGQLFGLLGKLCVGLAYQVFRGGGLVD